MIPKNATAPAPPPAADSLLVSFISKLSTSSSSAMRWSPTFSRQVDKLCSTPKVEHQLVQLAHFNETYFTPANYKFENTSYFAQTDLFHLWECALACALAPKLVPGKKIIPLNTILHLMERDDFSLNPQVLQDNCHEAKRKYNKLLVATFELATLILRSSTAVDETNFAAQALSIFLFRLPYCSTLLANALGQKEVDEDKRMRARFEEEEDGTQRQRRRRRHRDDDPVPVQPPKFTPFTLPNTQTDADRDFVRSNPDLFYWNATFTDPAITGMVVELIQEHSAVWTRYLLTKEAFFLRFVEHLVVHVTRLATGAVRWTCVPAYAMILNCFVALLRSAIWWDSIVQRSAGSGVGWVTSMAGYMKVKRTALMLLQSNASLLPFYVQTTFECTNLFSLLSVDSCIEHLQLFITATAVPSTISSTMMRARKSTPLQLATTFDYSAFWKPFSKIIESESYQVLLKSCSFLYNVLDLFVGAKRTKLVSDLLQPDLFWRLFLHWSGEVRTCFHHLVVYKILRCDRRFLPCFSDSQVMLLYGMGKRSSSCPRRIETSAQAAWGKLTSSFPSFNSQAADCTTTTTAEEIAQLTKSAQRRMAIFDTQVDDEELWFDMSVSSKIDSFVRMCLQFEEDGGGVPRHLRVYVEPALEQYSLLLIRYYRGATLASLDDIPVALTHRMVLTEFSDTTASRNNK